LTNTIYEAVDVSQQTISESTTSNSYQWVFSFPQQTTPVYALSRLKVISFSGTPTLTLYGGSNQVSTLAINSSSSGGDTGGGVTALQVTNIANAAAAQWATNPATAGVYLGTNAMIFVGGGKTNTLTFNGTNFISVITP
jgi:hypothetical protein